jgi:signal peptidase I
VVSPGSALQSEVLSAEGRFLKVNKCVTGWISGARTAVKVVALFLLFVGLLKATVVEAFFVPSASMVPTVLAKDYILVPKLSYGLRLPFVSKTVISWASPSVGDVIVFNRSDDPLTTQDEGRENLVKRVIALSGDLVEVAGTLVIVNGTKLEEPYARWSNGGMAVGGTHWGPKVVPQGEVFVLGDNRDESRDSRIWTDPFVRVNRIQGKAALIYWSSEDFKRSGKVL